MAIQTEGGGQFRLVQRVYDGGARIWCTPNVSLHNFRVKLIVFSCCSVGAIENGGLEADLNYTYMYDRLIQSEHKAG